MVVSIITELIFSIFISFIFAGSYWFIASVVFMAATAPFLSVWRVVFIAHILIRMAVVFLAPPIRYCNNVGKEWDANSRYLKWAKEHGKDPRDPNNW